MSMAKIFLESLWLTNKSRHHVVLSTRSLSNDQIKELKDIYPGVVIENKLWNWPRMAEMAQLPVSVLKKYKKEVENQYVTPENRIWKLMVAGEDRPKALFDVMVRNDVPMLHFDIDTLFRAPVDHIYKTIEKHDLCLLLRPNVMPLKARITISTIGIMKNYYTMEFFSKWFDHLAKVPPIHRPIGFGQTSCWYAFEEMPHLRVHKLDSRWGYPGKRNNREDNYIWSGAVHKLTKDDCVKLFERELENLK